MPVEFNTNGKDWRELVGAINTMKHGGLLRYSNSGREIHLANDPLKGAAYRAFYTGENNISKTIKRLSYLFEKHADKLSENPKLQRSAANGVLTYANKLNLSQDPRIQRISAHLIAHQINPIKEEINKIENLVIEARRTEDPEKLLKIKDSAKEISESINNIVFDKENKALIQAVKQEKEKVDSFLSEIAQKLQNNCAVNLNAGERKNIEAKIKRLIQSLEIRHENFKKAVKSSDVHDKLTQKHFIENLGKELDVQLRLVLASNSDAIKDTFDEGERWQLRVAYIMTQ